MATFTGLSQGPSHSAVGSEIFYIIIYIINNKEHFSVYWNHFHFYGVESKVARL